MRKADRSREQLAELFRLHVLPSVLQARRLLIRLSQELTASRIAANESLAKLVNSCVLAPAPDMWRDLFSQFGVPDEMVPSLVLDFNPVVEASPIPIDEQQRLLGRALALHKRTVSWIYEVGLVLESDFSGDEQYWEWRRSEDELEKRLADICARKDMRVLASTKDRIPD